ncbi:MAG: hypothetical protein JNK56_20110, partial [Myxococcales bacterium]|nr:hypothetical protein [Myxococcales bacterium]
MPKARYSPVLALLLAACGDPGDAADTADTGTTPAATGTTAATSTTDVATSKPGTSGELPTTTTAPTTGGSDTPAGLELMQRLAGLWTGPATMTPLGTFARMNMDLRAASAQVLFSRADLDEMNNLRFAFELEAPDGETTLVYRNGGYFLGLLRDSRTRLVEHTADSYRFCSTGAPGCDYIDARWTFSAADALIFDVKVKGQQHVYWDAERVDTRTLPDPFPADHDPLASDADFPPMPSLKVDVSWADPLESDGAVWIILTTMDCDLQFKCVYSRSLTRGAS